MKITDRSSHEALEEENARLRARVAELEGCDAFGEGSVPLHTLLRSVVENAPMQIYARDRDGRYLLANPQTEAFLQRRWKDLRGKLHHDLLPKELADRFQAQDREIMESGSFTTLTDEVEQEDGVHTYITTKFPVHDASGNVAGVCGISTDITPYARVEEERRRLQEEMLRLQEATVRAMSAPLLPIAEGVLVMPLVGDMGRARAEHIMSALLEGIAAHRARIAILDVTGVTSAGAEITGALLTVAQAARLVGAEVVITGIRPSMARALVELGAELQGIVTRGTLQSGVKYALTR